MLSESKAKRHLFDLRVLHNYIGTKFQNVIYFFEITKICIYKFFWQAVEIMDHTKLQKFSDIQKMGALRMSNMAALAAPNQLFSSVVFSCF